MAKALPLIHPVVLLVSFSVSVVIPKMEMLRLPRQSGG